VRRPLTVHLISDLWFPILSRHEAKSGITGWAQVNGRNALTWQQKFALDVWYVDHWSLWLDFQILARTAWKVLKREGVNQPGHATVEYFRGSKG